MKKKLIALALTLVIALSLSACGKNENFALEIDGAHITSGIYAFYLNEVLTKAEEYKIKPTDKAAIEQKTQQLCKQYIAATNFMKTKSIELEQYLKREVANETQNIWGMFSAYYNSIGVNKTDITNVITHEKRKAQLVNYYFGEKGINPIDEDDLKEEFVDVYIGFKAIEAPLTKTNELGEVVALIDDEKSSLEKTFSNLVKKINDGDITIDDANEIYNESLGLLVTDSLPLSVIKDKNPMYDDGFFAKVLDITHETARLVKTESSYYIILRQKIATTDDDAFTAYRSEILNYLKMPSVEKKVASLGDELNAIANIDLTNEIFETLNTVRSDNK